MRQKRETPWQRMKDAVFNLQSQNELLRKQNLDYYNRIKELENAAKVRVDQSMIQPRIRLAEALAEAIKFVVAKEVL